VTRLDWLAVLAPAKSWSKKKERLLLGELHQQKPDRDNIDKAVLDALFKDDSGISCGLIRKIWGRPEGLWISIEYRKGFRDESIQER